MERRHFLIKEKPFLDTVYVETRVIDNIQSQWDNFAEFVNIYGIVHVAIGILDIPTNEPICGVNESSLLVNFIQKVNLNTRISIHPFDGFANPKYPLRYNEHIGLNAVMYYIADLNKLFQKMNLKRYINSIVVGESMGGYPYRGDAESVKQFKNAAREAGIQDIKIGAAAGDIVGMGLDELYYQIYDWTFYNTQNPNFWEQFSNDPKGFFNALNNEKVNKGWNGDECTPPWSEFKNYLKKDGWVWQIDPDNQQILEGKQFMVAMSVPKQSGGLQPRLEAWKKWDGVINFFEYVKTKMSSKFKFALYLNEGLEHFKSDDNENNKSKTTSVRINNNSPQSILLQFNNSSQWAEQAAGTSENYKVMGTGEFNIKIKNPRNGNIHTDKDVKINVSVINIDADLHISY